VADCFFFVFFQCINSINRELLNEAFLDEASMMSNVSIHFGCKVQSVNFDERRMLVHNSSKDEDTWVNFDFLVGADGSYSVVKRQLMRVVRFVPFTLTRGHGLNYLYFSIPPAKLPHPVWTTNKNIFRTNTSNSKYHQA
jgi:2-polyprenyl-6-methoxyphenol hydroxylase-like FAD-dependent oxidoreductase